MAVDEIGHRGVAAISIHQGVVGRQRHRRVDLLDGPGTIAHPGLRRGAPQPCRRRIGVDAQRSLETAGCEIEILVQIGRNVAVNGERHRFHAVAFDCRPRKVVGLRRVIRRIGRPSLSDTQHMPVRPPGKSSRVVWILRDRGVEQRFGCLEDRARGIVHVLLGAQKEVVGLEAVRSLDADAVHLSRVQVGCDLLNNHFGQAVLNLKEVGKSFIELREPERSTQLCVGQLDRQTQAILENSHTARENVANPQYVTNLARVTILVPEGQRRQPRNYEKIRHTRQCFDQILD